MRPDASWRSFLRPRTARGAPGDPVCNAAVQHFLRVTFVIARRLGTYDSEASSSSCSAPPGRHSKLPICCSWC